MKKEIHIVHLYATISFEGGDEWSAQFGNDLHDAFVQLDTFETAFDAHNVSIHSLEAFDEKIAQADFIVVSVNQASLELPIYVDHLKNLTVRFDSLKVFKLLHSPLTSTMPVDIEKLLGYRFYNLQSLEQVDFKKYWNKLVDLTYDIIYRVTDRKVIANVYLAETIEKYDFVRDDVKRELLKRGYGVLPYKSHDLRSFSQGYEEDLNNCTLSVHLVGSGNADDITSENVADTQNDLASHYSLTHPEFKRIIWLSEETNELLEDEYLYIEKFKRNKQSLNGAEVVQVPTEKLKNIVLSRLGLVVNTAKEESTNLEVSNNSVYLISEQEDKEELVNVKAKLEAKGLDVITIDYSQNQLDVFKEHRNCLAKCDSVIILHTRDNIKWLRMKVLDLMKAPGYGRTYPFKAKGVYIKDSSLLDKVSSLLDGVIDFSEEGSFGSESVTKFYDKLNSYA